MSKSTRKGKHKGVEQDDNDKNFSSERFRKMKTDEFDSEFQNMLDDMNITNIEMRKAILGKDRETKISMLSQFKKNSEKPFVSIKKSHNPQTPNEFADELQNAMSNPEYLLSIMQMLRVNLSTQPLSWIYSFIHLSLDTLQSIMTYWVSPPKYEQQIGQKILHECVRCLKSIMDSQDGLNLVLQNNQNLINLTRCIFPSNSSISSDSLRILAAVSLISPSKILQSLSIVGYDEEIPRFSRLLACLESHQPICLRTNAFLLINALITTSDNVGLRMSIRNELFRAGLHDIIKDLRSLGNDTINVQIEIYEESREEDSLELENTLNNIQSNFKNIEDTFTVLYKSLKSTPAEPFFHAILQTLMLIGGDIVRRKSYFQIIEEIVSQIILQKNGIDPDFRMPKLEINLEPLIEGTSNRTEVEEAWSRLDKLEEKYSQQVTACTEVETKLEHSQKLLDLKTKELESLTLSINSKIFEYEEKLKESAKKTSFDDKLKEDYENKIKLLTEEVEKLKNKLIEAESKVGTGSAPQPVGQDVPPPPPLPSSLAPVDDGAPPPPPPPLPSSLAKGDDSCAPPPPLPSSLGGDGGAPPPPPSAPRFRSGGPGGPPSRAPAAPKSNKKKYNPPVTTKRLNWVKLNAGAIPKNSFWSELDETSLENKDVFEKIHDLFVVKKSVKLDTPSSGNADNKKKQKELRVIDSKTQQNVSIFIGSVKCSFDELIKKILSFDKSVINENFVENMIKFLPPAESMLILSELKPCYDELVDAEQLFVKLSDIPFLNQRLELMKIILKFQEQIDDVKPQIASVISSCKEIRGNNKFLEALKLILLLGNYMNAGSRNEQSVAFDIHFLSKLRDTKTQDSSVTFLHFLAEIITESYPSISGFEREMTSICNAMKVSDDIVSAPITQLTASLNNLEKSIQLFEVPCNEHDTFGKILTDFHSQASESLDVTKQMLDSMREKFSDLCSFLGVDSAKFPIEEFFEVINTFVSNYERAIIDNRRRKEKIEKDRIAQARKEQERQKREERKKVSETKSGAESSSGSGMNNEKEDGVIDNLLQGLESGSAFQTGNKGLRKKKTAAASEMRKERTRTMNMNSKAMFNQLIHQIGKKDDEFEEQI